MTAGETILKFTDYPFAYSIIGIISGMIGFSLGQNSIIFLGLAGAVGTFLTIVDPLGETLRKNAKRRIKKRNKIEKLDDLELQFKLSSLKSKSITYEMEKIIGMFYFVIIIILFLIAIVVSTPFFDKLVILDSNKVPLCNEWCFKFSYLGLGLSALIIISEKGRQFWKELDNKVNIAASHMSMINDDNATQTSIESMTRAVEQNDWELANLWSHKIEDEILNKKGKRELIIKAADTVFSPLHRESIAFEQGVNSMIYSYRYPTFDHKEWDEITRNSYQSIIEDTELRYRIDSFYKLALDYNNKQGSLGRIINDILYKHASDIFDKKDVFTIEYEIESPNGNGNAELFGCALFSTHPLDFYRVRGKLRHILVRSRDGGNQINSTFHDNILFDKMWDLVIKEIDLKDEIMKIRQMFEQVKTENSKLIKIYSEKIGMQWNV